VSCVVLPCTSEALHPPQAAAAATSTCHARGACFTRRSSGKQPRSAKRACSTARPAACRASSCALRSTWSTLRASAAAAPLPAALPAEPGAACAPGSRALSARRAAAALRRPRAWRPRCASRTRRASSCAIQEHVLCSGCENSLATWQWLRGCAAALAHQAALTRCTAQTGELHPCGRPEAALHINNDARMPDDLCGSWLKCSVHHAVCLL